MHPVDFPAILRMVCIRKAGVKHDDHSNLDDEWFYTFIDGDAIKGDEMRVQRTRQGTAVQLLRQRNLCSDFGFPQVIRFNCLRFPTISQLRVGCGEQY